MRLIRGGNSGGVLLLDLHPAAAPDPPHGSLVAWVVVACLLAVVLVVGVALSSRR